MSEGLCDYTIVELNGIWLYLPDYMVYVMHRQVYGRVYMVSVAEVTRNLCHYVTAYYICHICKCMCELYVCDVCSRCPPRDPRAPQWRSPVQHLGSCPHVGQESAVAGPGQVLEEWLSSKSGASCGPIQCFHPIQVRWPTSPHTSCSGPSFNLHTAPLPAVLPGSPW